MLHAPGHAAARGRGTEKDHPPRPLFGKKREQMQQQDAAEAVSHEMHLRSGKLRQPLLQAPRALGRAAAQIRVREAPRGEAAAAQALAQEVHLHAIDPNPVNQNNL